MQNFKKDTVRYFGLYPQKLIKDKEEFKTVNEYRDDNIIKDYGYYYDGKQEEYMAYTDIDCHNGKYRMVAKKKNRPTFIHGTNSNLDESVYKHVYDNHIALFKWQPIKWKIIKEDEDKMLLVSDLILDSQDFYVDIREDEHLHNGDIGFSNNYKLSHIRQWLNDTFYNYAFTDKEKELILDTDVDNSSDITGVQDNNYSCENTKDKVFLLSYKEAMDGFENDYERIAKGTDYAKSQGLLVEDDGNSYWWLRSPNCHVSSSSLYVYFDGYINPLAYYEEVDNTSFGVRPAIWVKKKQ